MLAPASDDTLLTEARQTTRRVARTFSLAARLLPRELRDDVYLLYLVFRTLDDLVDEGDPDAERAVSAVERWCAGDPPESREAEILADLDGRHALPRASLLAFCAGMRHDLAGARCATEEELDRYCYRVAGTVGETMTALLGCTDPERALPAASALGRAMQRTNILRDIDEDLANGRIYLAAGTIERFGGAITPGAREALLRDQIARADALYDEGIAGIGYLRCGRRAIGAAAAMYREILRQIEREGYGRHAGRAIVPRRRKLLVAARTRV